MTLFDRRPVLRWLVPGATVAVVAAGAVIAGSSVSADAGLESLTPEELLVAVSEAPPQPLSGTVEVRTDLGLPELPGGYGPDGADPMSLIGGTTTLRVWSDGPERTRVAILGDAAEYDMIRNGDQFWTWSSDEATATRHSAADRPGSGEPALPVSMPSTPQEAAEQALAAVDPTTDVSVTGVASVAGRPVYELVLTPQDPSTRISRITLAIDAETMTPLRVRAYSTQLSEPAVDIGFTSVDFARPDTAVFDFTPPPGATVVEHDTMKPSEGDATKPSTSVVGSGWSQVVVTTMPAGTATDDTSADPSMTSAAGDAQALLESLPTVSGDWGTGRVIDGTLGSMIITEDGRIAVGAVDPATLAAALATG